MIRIRYGILASGTLGASCLAKIYINKSINFVFTDSNSPSIINFCQENNIPIFVGNPRTDRIIDFLKKFKTQIILSINYLFLVDNRLLNHAEKYAINFHGSLLPKYKGRTPHVWAIINNEKETGITSHIMTEGCDEGAIIYQERIPIDSEATGAELLQIFNNRYPEVINKVLKVVESENVVASKQDSSKATYFGKRTPLDGKINWNWQKEQIRNWVRAQARPYPGAFTFCGQCKIIVHRVAYDELGFHQNDLNGKIIGVEDDEIVVKTSNGALRLLDIEVSESIIFKIGEILHD